MPAIDTVLMKDQLAEDMHSDWMKTYYRNFFEDLRRKSSKEEAAWSTAEKGRRWAIRALQMSHNYYVAPDMFGLVTAAQETMPEDEPVQPHDFPTPQGWMWVPNGITIIDIRGKMVPTSAILWNAFGGRVEVAFIVDKTHPMDYLKEVVDEDTPRLTPWAMQTLHFDQPIPRTTGMGIVLPPEDADQIEYIQDKETGTTTIYTPRGYSPEQLQIRERPDEVCQWLLACLRLMQQSITSVNEQGLPANLRRGLKGRVKFKQTRIAVIEYRRREAYMHDPTSTREYSHRFLRRGHWRRVWFKDEEGEKKQRPVFIHPTIVGDPSLPLLLREHVNALVR